MYDDIYKLFQLKRDVALHLMKMGRKDLAETEMAMVLGVAKNAYHTEQMAYDDYEYIKQWVNEFCDSL